MVFKDASLTVKFLEQPAVVGCICVVKSPCELMDSYNVVHFKAMYVCPTICLLSRSVYSYSALRVWFHYLLSRL
jgi:hypothetical protein